MKIKVCYENSYQYLELDAEAADQLWVSLSLGSRTDLTDEEKQNNCSQPLMHSSTGRITTTGIS